MHTNLEVGLSFSILNGFLWEDIDEWKNLRSFKIEEGNNFGAFFSKEITIFPDCKI